jgi:hypothetical protein
MVVCSWNVAAQSPRPADRAARRCPSRPTTSSAGGCPWPSSRGWPGRASLRRARRHRRGQRDDPVTGAGSREGGRGRVRAGAGRPPSPSSRPNSNSAATFSCLRRCSRATAGSRTIAGVSAPAALAILCGVLGAGGGWSSPTTGMPEQSSRSRSPPTRNGMFGNSGCRAIESIWELINRGRRRATLCWRSIA